MAWTDSKMFAAFAGWALDRSAGGGDLDLDAFKVAIYNATTTPDNTVSLANSAYGVGQWVVGNELDDGVEWDAGGEPLVSPSITVTGTDIVWDAVDTVSGGTSVTVTDANGALHYDDTLTTPTADPGICYNYFGSGVSVVDGTLTLQYAVAGIASLSVA